MIHLIGFDPLVSFWDALFHFVYSHFVRIQIFKWNGSTCKNNISRSKYIAWCFFFGIKLNTSLTAETCRPRKLWPPGRKRVFMRSDWDSFFVHLYSLPANPVSIWHALELEMISDRREDCGLALECHVFFLLKNVMRDMLPATLFSIFLSGFIFIEKHVSAKLNIFLENTWSLEFRWFLEIQ